jgi:glycosyltransferase involved in cell wall biosynthesis
MPLPRIVAQRADDNGCGHYRIIEPAAALYAAGLADVRVTHDLASVRAELDLAASVVVQMYALPAQLDQLRALRRKKNLFMVQEVDDLIIDLPEGEAFLSAPPADLAERIRQTAAQCDRLVVSTPPLAEALQSLHTDIRVIPNRLDRARWAGLAPTAHTGSKPRVGWAGGSSHLRDLALLAKVVEALADEVDWVFMGLCPDELLPFVQEFHHGVPFGKYPRKLANLGLDLALAPLAMDAFNRAKSNLKLLEYGVLGYPVICTNIEPYQRDLPVTRIVNEAEAWVEAIRQHIADRTSLAARGQALQAAVLRDWMLDKHLAERLAAWLPSSDSEPAAE